MPRLIELLKHKLPGIRHGGAVSLAKIGPAAQDAVPALKKALTDDVRFVRVAAKTALKQITQRPR